MRASKKVQKNPCKSRETVFIARKFVVLLLILFDLLGLFVQIDFLLRLVKRYGFAL